jgi:urease accessory protein UreH
MVTTGKLHWGTLSFRPAEVGQYYLVLDNSHSSFTLKVVHVLAYWLSHESPIRKTVRESLALFGWHDTWNLFEKTEQALMNRQLAVACFNMRTAIATLWKQVAETNSGC